MNIWGPTFILSVILIVGLIAAMTDWKMGGETRLFFAGNAPSRNCQNIQTDLQARGNCQNIREWRSLDRTERAVAELPEYSEYSKDSGRSAASVGRQRAAMPINPVGFVGFELPDYSDYSYYSECSLSRTDPRLCSLKRFKSVRIKAASSSHNRAA